MHEPQHWHVPGSYGIIIGLLTHCLGESRGSPAPPLQSQKNIPNTNKTNGDDRRDNWMVLLKEIKSISLFICKQIHWQENRNRSVLQ